MKSALERVVKCVCFAMAGVSSKRLLIRDGKRSKKAVKQTMHQQQAASKSPVVKRTGKSRTNPHVQMRVVEKYVAGKTIQSIADEEHIARDTVKRIVRRPDVDSYLEEKLEAWRGLCDESIEAVRRLIKKDDKQTVFRVLESNGVVAPAAMTINQNIVKETKSTEDDRVQNLRAKFADVMMERARVFKTPFPELAEIAKESDIKLDFDLNPPQNEIEDDEENEE